MNYTEFSKKIKSKYPQYADMDDYELAQKMVAKYPKQYNDVTFDKANKGINLTPSGMLDNTANAIASAIETPFRMAKNKQTVQQAFKSAYEQGKQARKEYEQKHPVISGVRNVGIDTLGYAKLPMTKIKPLGNIGNIGLSGLYQGAIAGGLEAMKNNVDNAGKGAGIGAGIGATVSTALGSIPYIGTPLKNLIKNPNVQNATARTLEALTSVPSDYTKTAIKNELAGNSIFKGKFNPDTAYRPIEQQVRKAKGMLPTSENFASEYNKLGKKAIEGMENIKTQAGADINDALQTLDNNPIDITDLQDEIGSVINSFAKGGDVNPANIRANREIDIINNVLGERGQPMKPIDLHNVKETLYDMANYETAGGIKNSVLKNSANRINNYLRDRFPQYIEPNDKYSLIMDVERGLDGSSTIAGKIKGIGSEANLLSSMDDRLRNIDTLLPDENKFFNQAKDLIKTENKVNQVKNTIGKQYERNPRLLANRTDEAFENSLNDLQKMTGVNFMDELGRVRAREAFENLFPGQGGGSGSSQGFGNLLRTSIIGGVPTASLLTHNPLALLGLGAISPKIMGQGTIKNLGKLYNLADNLYKFEPETVSRYLVTPSTELSTRILGDE